MLDRSANVSDLKIKVRLFANGLLVRVKFRHLRTECYQIAHSVSVKVAH